MHPSTALAQVQASKATQNYSPGEWRVSGGMLGVSSLSTARETTRPPIPCPGGRRRSVVGRPQIEASTHRPLRIARQALERLYHQLEVVQVACRLRHAALFAEDRRAQVSRRAISGRLSGGSGYCLEWPGATPSDLLLAAEASRCCRVIPSGRLNLLG